MKRIPSEYQFPSESSDPEILYFNSPNGSVVASVSKRSSCLSLSQWFLLPL